MMPFRPKTFVVFCFLFVLVPWMASPAQVETVDKIVARVGSDVITLSDLARASAQQRNYFFQKFGKEDGKKKFQEFSQNALEELILDRVLRSEIKKEGCEPSELEVSQEYESRLKQMGMSEPSLLDRLSRDGISLADYKDNIRYDVGRQRLIQKKIMPRIAVSDYDLQKEYEKNISLYQTYNKFSFVEVYLTPDKFPDVDALMKIARKIHADLTAKRNVASLIKQYSSGAFAANGGNSGLVESSQLRPEIVAALSRLKAGEVSPIMPTQQGVFIFKLISKADPKPLPYNEVSAQVRSRYYDQIVSDELKKYLVAIKDQMFVEITP
jgi:peptidyl-prolyl cis-trans isomerase SurA